MPLRIPEFFERTNLLGLLFLIGLLYLPAFLVPFSFHDDGNLISGTKGDILNGYFETGHDFVEGRPFLGLFLGIQTTLTKNIFCLALTRLLAFTLLGLFAYTFYHFLTNRCHVDQQTSKFISLTVLTFPVSILFIVWSQEFSAGVLTANLTIFAYLLADLGQEQIGKTSILSAFYYVFSSLLFLTALLFYPPVAMSVFAFGLIKLILSPTPISQLRIPLSRDIIYWPALMVIYLLIVKLLVLPWAFKIYSMAPDSDSTYQFTVSFSLLSKLQLLKDLVFHSVNGPLDLLPDLYGMLTMAILLAIFFVNNRLKIDQKSLMLPIEKIIWGLILFLLANSPILLAKGCLSVPGYRVLFPNALIWSVIIYKFIGERKNLSRKISSYLFFALVLLSAAGMANVVANSHEEYKRITQQLKPLDLSSYKRIFFLLKKPQDHYVGWLPSLDLNLHSVMFEHDIFYVEKQLPYNASLPTIEGGFPSQIFYVTPQTAVIDLNHPESNMANIMKLPGAIQLSYTPPDPGLTVKCRSHDGPGSLILLDTVKNDQKFDYWSINGGQKYAIMQLESATPKRIEFYSSFSEADGSADKVAWFLLGSNDGENWIKLNFQIKPLDSMPVRAVQDMPYSYYRIIWLKDPSAQAMHIHGVLIGYEI